MPFSIRCLMCLLHIKLQAAAVCSSTPGTPIRSAASRAKLISVSVITQLTGRPWWFNLSISSLRGAKQLLLVDTHRDLMSCVEVPAPHFGGGRPSGMVANWKSDGGLMAALPRDWRRRLWLYWVRRKVIWKPLTFRIMASLNMGFMWPCAGKGMQIACGLCVFAGDSIALMAFV